MYLKYIKDQEEDGYNFYKKYMVWHGKQYTDIQKNIKWCPVITCDSIIEMKDTYVGESVV